VDGMGHTLLERTVCTASADWDPLG
jgi:hypothetical protein